MAERSALSSPVVALHGFSDSGACMRPFLRRLGATDATTPDLLAHGGRAMPPGTGFTHEVLAADALDAVAAVAAARGEPVVLIGHSLGASTAAGVAASAPEIVRALVLEDPPWQVPIAPGGDDPADRLAEQANGHRPWLAGLAGTDHEGRLGWLRANEPGWPADEHDPWAQAKAQVDLRLFDAPQRWLRRTWPRVVDDVACPTLLVVGDPRRGAACESGVAETLSRRPGWVVQRFDTGHNVRREQPDRLAALLRAYLASV